MESLFLFSLLLSVRGLSQKARNLHARFFFVSIVNVPSSVHAKKGHEMT